MGDETATDPRPPAPNRLPDHGPRYKETPADPSAPDAPAVAEPWNTVTAALFVLLAAAWVVRLRGRWRRYPFLAGCLPILLVGGVGGTLYHARRTRPLYFYLDVVPIYALGLAGGAFLAVRLWRRKGYLYIAAGVAGLVGFGGLLQILLTPAFPGLLNLAVNASYAALALVLLAPLGVTLVRSRFRHAGLVLAALAAFAVAWFCRLVDGTLLSDLPMGTHWLWHLFGAITTGFVVEYFYRVEGEG
jgi:hypothetical protein